MMKSRNSMPLCVFPVITAAALSLVVSGCAIDPVIPPKMLREIKQTTPVCHGDAQCVEMMRTAKRWLLQRGNPWGLGKRVKNGHVLPKADTMLALDDHQIVLMDWHRSPGAYFAYWILRATIFGVRREGGSDGDRLGLRYTYHFKGRTLQRTSTDYDARTSWGKTVLAFNQHVRDSTDYGRRDTTRRVEVVNRIRRLEQAPLSEHANDDRKWLMAWLLNAPELDQARYCIDALGPEWRLDYRYAEEIETQLLFASVTPWLERPDVHSGNAAAYSAGLQSMLKAYQAILRDDPDARQPGLDLLLERQRQGLLNEYLLAQAFIDAPDGCAAES